MSKLDLTKYGLKGVKEIFYNPSYDMLFEHELNSSLEGFEKGQLSELDAVNVMTGEFTGRSPKDKYIVKDSVTENTVWWTSDKAKNDNKPITQTVWEDLKSTVAKQLSGKLYMLLTLSAEQMKIRV